MGVRVAYGNREDVIAAINSAVIPKGCLIFAKTDGETEFLFYDTEGKLLTVEERTRFNSYEVAEEWVKEYECTGLIFSILKDGEWAPYVVQDDQTLRELAPVATNEIAGLVIGNEVENGVVIDEDGKLSVYSVNANKIIQNEGDVLILDGSKLY